MTFSSDFDHFHSFNQYFNQKMDQNPSKEDRNPSDITQNWTNLIKNGSKSIRFLQSSFNRNSNRNSISTIKSEMLLNHCPNLLESNLELSMIQFGMPNRLSLHFIQSLNEGFST